MLRLLFMFRDLRCLASPLRFFDTSRKNRDLSFEFRVVLGFHMSRITYINGRYTPFEQASLSWQDRGGLFADGVYEAIAFEKGHLLNEQDHFDRLTQSLKNFRIPFIPGSETLSSICREVVRRNRVSSGVLYIQMTRGIAPRLHTWGPGMKPTLIISVLKGARIKSWEERAKGGKVVTLPDERWDRVFVKSTCLTPNVLSKQKAQEGGGIEAWLFDQKGLVTEGTASNTWIVNGEGILLTRPLDGHILPGVTRKKISEIAKKKNVPFRERSFSLEEAFSAQEAFITSTTQRVQPITQIDDYVIGKGKVGPVTEKLAALYDALLEA